MDIRNNQERAKMAINVFYGMGVAIVIMMISNIMQFNLLQQEYISDAAATSNDNRQLMVSGLYLIFLAACAYVFINWMRRAYYNLHQLRSDLKYQESYAAWGWFIPIVSLWYPYQIMKEIWIHTQTESDLVGIESHSLLRNWWIAWVLNSVSGNIAARFPADTVEQLVTGTQISIFSDVISLLGLILAIQVIKKVSEYEDALYNSTHEISIEDHLIE